MRKLLRKVLFLVAMAMVVGKVAIADEPIRYSKLPAIASENAVTPSATLARLTNFIGSQLANNRSIKNITESRIAIASFVDIENLGQVSPLGMQVAENLMHEMHVRGFSVVDFKTRDALKVRPGGDFVFSRDLADLKREQNIHYFLSGTITLNSDGAVINARLIDAENSLICSTAQGFLSKRDLHRILNGEKPIVPSVPPSRIMLK
jgi:TolB-like protein